MASAAAIVAPTASPISSSKYGSCQLSGDPMTPSSATNSDATTSSTTRRKPARQQVRPVVQHLGAPPFLRSDADRGRGPYPSARRAYGPSYRTRIDSTFLESCQDGGAGADPANNRGFCRTLGEQSKGGQFGQASHLAQDSTSLGYSEGLPGEPGVPRSATVISPATGCPNAAVPRAPAKRSLTRSTASCLRVRSFGQANTSR